jgi:hypothetical protein
VARVALFLFEGAAREVNYFDSLLNTMSQKLPQKKHQRELNVICSYGNDLYELYTEVADDDDLNLVVLLKEGIGNADNSRVLQGIDEDQVTDIYLFFDMEIQATKYSDAALLKMLETFNDEANLGKIFISYPMVEAIRHIYEYETFNEVKIPQHLCKGSVYKNHSVQNTITKLADHTKLNINDWESLTKANIKKSHYMINENSNYGFPPDQQTIAKFQIAHKNDSGSIYVLSAYPFFAVDYYGVDLFD